MSTAPVLRYIIAGQLRRNFILNHQGRAFLDVPGGSLLYAAAGLAIWESGIGLIARVGENFPQEWLAQAAARGFDTRGIRTLTQEIDHRYFAAYPDPDTRSTDNPVAHFARLGMPFPKALLGYTPPVPQLDSRLRPGPLTLRQNDFPTDYLDATAAHLCPMDFLSHTLLPSILRQGQIHTITLEPGANYMNPVFWDDMPVLMNGLSAFICSETRLNGLFQGRSTDLWEMAAALAGCGCDLIVIQRGSQGQYVYHHSARARWIVPAYPVQPLDPTGAGDAFCGGFLAGLRASYDPLYAALTGSISASMVMEGAHPFYALDSLPGLAQARLEALRDRVRRV
mgnify:CR=1 FL=1